MVSGRTLYGLYILGRLSHSLDRLERVRLLKKAAALIHTHYLEEKKNDKAKEFKEKVLKRLTEIEAEIYNLEALIGAALEDLRIGWSLRLPDSVVDSMVSILTELAEIEAKVVFELSRVLGELQPAEIAVAPDVVKLLRTKKSKKIEEGWEDVPDF